MNSGPSEPLVTVEHSIDNVLDKAREMLEQYEAICIVGVNVPTDDGNVDSATFLTRIKESEFNYDDGMMYTLMSLFMATADRVGPEIMMKMLDRMAAEVLSKPFDAVEH